MSFGLWLDDSMDHMEETRVKKKHIRLIKEFSKKTKFTTIELESLVLVYHKVKRGVHLGSMTKDQFKEVLHHGLNMTDFHLMDRIITAIEASGTANPTAVSLESWLSSMSLFLKGTLQEKIIHCFSVYNVMGDGLIGRDIMFQLMRKSLISSGSDDDPEESVKDLMETLTKKMDLDRDGKISFNDYKQSVMSQPQLLECFGPCLPDKLAVQTFSVTIFTSPISL